MKHKLIKKYLLAVALVIFVSFFSIFMILSVVLNHYMAKDTYNTLRKSCEQVSQTVSEVAKNKTNDALKGDFLSISRTLSSVIDADIFITDEYGAVVVCACDEWQENVKCLHSSYIMPKDVITRAINGKRAFVGKIDMYAHPQCIAANEIKLDNTYYVIATAPIAQVENLMSKMTKLFMMSAAVPTVLMFLLFFVITYRMAKPLKSMSEAAKAIVKGDFSKRIPVTSDDEIGDLAVSFNMMTNSLARLETMRRSFVGSVSHELRTPMTTISGFIDGILDGTIPEDRRDYYLAIVSSEVKRLSRLVSGMLDIAKLEAGEVVLKYERFNFNEMLCGIVLGQEQRIEKAGLEIKGLDGLLDTEIVGDKDLIHQVLYNLVDNAIKFTNENGEISFSVTIDNDNLAFIIKNTGGGIPESELPFVFERFYKGDKSRSDIKNSLGLGLYLVKTIVSAHNGQVSVTSKQGEFTAFKVILPKGEH